jgi:hypothetical protein
MTSKSRPSTQIVKKSLKRIPLGKQCPLCKAIVSRRAGKMICDCENKLKIKKQSGGVCVYRWKLEKGEDYYPERRATPITSKEKVAIIGDTHGRLLVLKEVLLRAGVIDESGKRNPEFKRVIHIGDLMDGRRAGMDKMTLEFADDVFDEVLVGNHEAAYMGGESFSSMEAIDPESQRILNRWEREGKLVVATCVDDWLLTHGGLDPELSPAKTPSDSQELPVVATQEEVEAVVEVLNDTWRFQRHSDAFKECFLQIGEARGGMAEYGGVLWNDFSRLVATESQQRYKQVVGHTPQKEALVSPQGMVVNVDAGKRGKKVSSCLVVDSEGSQVVMGSAN